MQINRLKVEIVFLIFVLYCILYGDRHNYDACMLNVCILFMYVVCLYSIETTRKQHRLHHTRGASARPSSSILDCCWPSSRSFQLRTARRHVLGCAFDTSRCRTRRDHHCHSVRTRQTRTSDIRKVAARKCWQVLQLDASTQRSAFARLVPGQSGWGHNERQRSSGHAFFLVLFHSKLNERTEIRRGGEVDEPGWRAFCP